MSIKAKRMQEMITSGKTPVRELNQAFWACHRRIAYPLTHHRLSKVET